MLTNRNWAPRLLPLLLVVLAACDGNLAPLSIPQGMQLRLSATALEVTDGEAERLKATLVDARGAVVADAETKYVFDWRAQDSTVVQVEAAGSEAVVRYVAEGSTEVTVTASPAPTSGMAGVKSDGSTLSGASKVRSTTRPGTIRIASGDGQSARMGTLLPQPLVARVMDRQGAGVAGIRVTYTASAGGSVSPAEAVSDADGYVRTAWTLGASEGEQRVDAAAASKIGKVAFVAQALPAASPVMKVTAGDGQSATISTTLPTHLQVTVQDAAGQPQSGVAVTWSVLSGSGSMRTVVGTTGSDGRSSASWTLGPLAGTQQARASWNQLEALFTATAVPAISTVTSVTVEPASASLSALGASTQLNATARDASGTTRDTVIQWSTSSTSVASVDATGKVMAKAVGTALIVASVAGIADTSRVTVQQVPASIKLSSTSLSLQSGATAQLQAVVSDAGGAVIPASPVSWSTSASSVATVSSAGLVTAVSAGNATIKAVSGSASASASVAVQSAPIAAPPASAGIWMSAAEIAALPTSGSAWSSLKAAADQSCGTPDLSNQDDPANVCVMAKALVYARVGGATYRDGVLSAIRAVTNSGTYSGRALALGRELGAYVVAADLVNLAGIDPTLDAAFRTKLKQLRTTATLEGPTSLVECHENRPNNWGLHCGASLAAIAVYLDDDAALTRLATVFRGWLGDRSAYAGFSYGDDLSWQADPARPVGINPKGATRNGYSIDGVQPEEMRRCGSFQWPPCATGYNWEALQGAVALAWILHHQGMPAFEWSDRALLRAVQWLHTHAKEPAEGDDTWLPHIVNRVYGTSFPAPVPSRAGKNLGWADWTHAR